MYTGYTSAHGGGDYCTTDMYTSDEMFDKVFNSEQVLTLDELPDWRKY